MSPRLTIAAAILCAGLSGAASAQDANRDPHAVQPERPTVATHAGTVAAGWLEIEAGSEFDRFDDHTNGTQIPIVFKVGLAPCVQLNVQTPAVRPPTGGGTGFGDMAVGVKWRMLTGAPGVGDFAILPGVKLPSGSADAGTGTDTTDVSFLVISSHEFNGVSMDLNAGYTRRSGDGSVAPRNATVWTASFGGPARGRLGWVAELYGYPATSGPISTDAIVALLTGPTVQVESWLALDTGFIAPIAGPQPRAFYFGGVYNVGRLWNARR